MRFLLPALMFLAVPDEKGSGGAAPKLSIADQLSASQTRVTELEGLQAGWNGEQASLTTARDTAQGEVATVRGQLTAVTSERDAALTRATTAEGQLAAANTNLTAMTAERDRFKATAENPSVQARTILATAGGPAVPMQGAGTAHPGEVGAKVAAVTPGQTGLKAAIAKSVARAEQKKS